MISGTCSGFRTISKWNPIINYLIAKFCLIYCYIHCTCCLKKVAQLFSLDCVYSCADLKSARARVCVCVGGGIRTTRKFKVLITKNIKKKYKKIPKSGSPFPYRQTKVSCISQTIFWKNNLGSRMHIEQTNWMITCVLQQCIGCLFLSVA